MNQITKKKHRRSRPFRMSFLVGALFCAFLTTTERAFSEIPLIAVDLAWVAPSVLLASEDFDSVTSPAAPPGLSSPTQAISSAVQPTPTQRLHPKNYTAFLESDFSRQKEGNDSSGGRALFRQSAGQGGNCKLCQPQ